MKKCPKCEKVFENDAFFCTKCGEKLIPLNTCPKCGADVQPDDAFCSKCGQNLKEKRVCHNCGANIKEDSQFCSSCGASLSNNSQNKETPKAESTVHNGLLHTIISYSTIGLFFLVCVLITIGFFGNIVTVHAVGMKESIGVRYFFGEHAKDLESIKNATKYPDIYIFNVVFFVIYSIFYFGGIVAFLLTLGFGICHGIKSLINKETFSKKYFLFAIFSALPYLMLTSYMFTAKTSITVNVTFAWGTKLLISGCIISAIAYCVSFITEDISQKSKIIIRSLVSTAFIFILIVGFYGIAKQVSMSQDGATAHVSLFTLVNIIVQSYSDSPNTYLTNAETEIVIAFVFSLIPLITLPLTLTTISSDRKFVRICAIICVSLLFAVTLVAGIIGAIGLNDQAIIEGDNSAFSSLGSGTILTMILSLLSIGVLSGSLAIKQKE